MLRSKAKHAIVVLDRHLICTVDTTTANIEKDELIGQPLFGSYVITRQIGKGGMGAVYLVESEELGTALAMKVLLGDAARLSTTVAGRFVAEARAASAINHRNIITILDSAQLPDGRRYILMEYLDGPTLREFSKQVGPLEPDVALAILAQVCSGLQAAHDRGIIHRDLKPSNILISPQPDNPYFTKILDFGIAKLSDPSLGSVETQTSALAGTPSYMAPEQARALKDVDHRTDIYALGVLTYRLFCGELPYRAHSIGELVHQQTTAQPVSLALKRPDLPREWVHLVHSAMAMNRAHRPQSAHEFAERMIAATPDGEAIARGSASLLFATQTASFSTTGTSAAAWSDVSMPDGTQSLATVSKATVAHRKVSLETPIPGWVQENPLSASIQPSEKATGSRVLILVLCFSTLAIVSSLVTWLVLRDNSTVGVEHEGTKAAPKVAPETAPLEMLPAIKPVIEPAIDEAIATEPRAGDEASGLEVTPSDTAPIEANTPTLHSKRGGDTRRKRGSKEDRKSRKTGVKEGTTPIKSDTRDGKRSDTTPKSDEEALFNLRK